MPKTQPKRRQPVNAEIALSFARTGLRTPRNDVAGYLLHFYSFEVIR